jgi:hypothetical protein
MQPDPINRLITYEHFGEPSPSSAFGRYRNMSFELYARWDDWYFVLSTDPEIEAIHISHFIDDERAILVAGKHPIPERLRRAMDGAFVRRGKYGREREWKASYMSQEDKMNIIRQRIEEYEDGLDGAGRV